MQLPACRFRAGRAGSQPPRSCGFAYSGCQGGLMQSSEQPAERLPRAAWRRYVRRWASACVVGWALTSALSAVPLVAAPGGTSSRAAKEEAVAEIPFDRLNKEVRGRLLEVLEKPSIFR